MNRIPKTSGIIRTKDLPWLRNKYQGKKIVFCSGSFDLTHAGHVLFFEDCKKEGDILVVCIGTDKVMRKYKKERSILNEKVRLKMISALKPVDYCFLQPWVPFETPNQINDYLHIVFTNLEPDVYVINDDAFGIAYRQGIIKKYPKVSLRILKRTAPKSFDDISTSKIIEKIRRIA